MLSTATPSWPAQSDPLKPVSVFGIPGRRGGVVATRGSAPNIGRGRAKPTVRVGGPDYGATNSARGRPHDKRVAIGRSSGLDSAVRCIALQRLGALDLSVTFGLCSNFASYCIRALLHANEPNWRVLGSIVVQ